MDPEQTIFHTKAGAPLSPANVRRLWRSIRDANADLLPEGMDLATVASCQSYLHGPHTRRTPARKHMLVLQGRWICDV